QVARKKGSDLILAVNLGGFFRYEPGAKRIQPWKAVDGWGRWLTRRELAKACAAGAQVHEIYSRQIESYSVYDFLSSEEIKREGYDAARQVLQTIRR
ncbi:MAG: hypothetical protein QHH30_11640, partial [candidate division NC10 bacterium]|nr:hypothetical protein [candidate division NC10 bacterium]